MCESFEESHSAEKCKRGPFGLLKTPFVARYQKLKGEPLKNVGKKRKMRILKLSHSAENFLKRGESFGFSTSNLLQNIKKIERGDIVKLSKKVSH